MPVLAWGEYTTLLIPNEGALIMGSTLKYQLKEPVDVNFEPSSYLPNVRDIDIVIL